MPSGGIEEMTASQAKRNPIVWACIALRLMVFSEVRFTFQGWQAGRPGKLFGTQDLTLLETPWPMATTGDLLSRMEVDASLYGNSYWVKSPGGQQLIRLKPTSVSIATVDAEDVETGLGYGKLLVGYIVKNLKGQVTSTFLPEEVCHYRPIPDPDFEFRGISWMNSLLPDIIADLDMSDFKHSFLKNAATPSLVVQFQQGVSQEAFDKFKDKLESAHTGPQSGFKTLYLGAGADVKVVGSNFQQLNINAVQGAGELRIASAAGVPPTLLSLSEGMQGSALNAGNYASTRRRFSDATMRPLWRTAAGALSTLVAVPAGSRLWYDGRDVPFLQEDETEAATIKSEDAKTILTYIQAGFEPDTVIQAVLTGDFTLLKHTGLVSVQLQKPGPTLPPGGEAQPDPRLPADDDLETPDADVPAPTIKNPSSSPAGA
jgi:HK97 family phage portal protein